MNGRRIPVLLMVRELGIGGSERQLAVIASALDRDRFEPHVACWHSKGLRTGELEAAGVPILQLPIRSFLSPAVLLAAATLLRYIRRHRIRLVHTFDAPSNVFAVPVVWLGRSAAVLSSQRCHRELVSSSLRSLLRLTDRLARRIVVNADFVRRHMIEDERVPPGRLRLCYNGVDAEAFARPGEARTRPPDLAGASLVVGVICGFRPEKDLATLVRAFAAAHARHPDLKLLLMGDGPCRKDLVRLAIDLGIADAAVFAPAASDVAPALRAIDIFVLPSLSEALSNSLMEAMASGCVPVASSVGGNPELVEHGETGLLFEPGDHAGLAGCLERLAGDPELRRRLSQAAAARMRQRFSIAAAAERMGAIYLEALS